MSPSKLNSLNILDEKLSHHHASLSNQAVSKAVKNIMGHNLVECIGIYGFLTQGDTEQEADRRLLRFAGYDDYLDSLIVDTDLFYLRSLKLSRKIAELGYRSSGETLSREKFYRRLNKAFQLVAPLRLVSLCTSTAVKLCRDPLAEQLAFRERYNRAGIVATVVFVRLVNSKDAELSAYVDYRDRLMTTDMTGFFEGKKRLYPRITDLGFYNWKNKICYTNDSPYFECIINHQKGILLRNKQDHLVIDLDSNLDPGPNTIRQTVYSPNYVQCIITDHVVRKRIG